MNRLNHIMLALVTTTLLFLGVSTSALSEATVDARSTRDDDSIRSEFSIHIDTSEERIASLFSNPKQLFSLLPGTRLEAMETTDHGYHVYLTIRNCFLFFCDTSTQTYQVIHFPGQGVLQGRLLVADSFTAGSFEIRHRKMDQGMRIDMRSELEADFTLSRFITRGLLNYKIRSFAKHFARNIEQTNS